MGILKTYVLVFMAGWLVWFLLDKNAPPMPPPAAAHFGGPQYPGFPRPPAAMRQPPAGDDMVQAFQYGVDLLKGGRYQQAFVYLWRNQSWVVAALVTALLAFVLPGASRGIRRWRNRRETGSKGA